jgi:hypothetical protein
MTKEERAKLWATLDANPTLSLDEVAKLAFPDQEIVINVVIEKTQETQ